MGMPAPRSVTTIDELLALPEDGMRHELLDGVHVVTPAPTRVHQRVLRRLDHALHRHIGPDAPVESSTVRRTFVWVQARWCNQTSLSL